MHIWNPQQFCGFDGTAFAVLYSAFTGSRAPFAFSFWQQEKRGECFASASRVEICTSIGDRVVKGFLGWYCAAAAFFPVWVFAS